MAQTPPVADAFRCAGTRLASRFASWTERTSWYGFASSTCGEPEVCVLLTSPCSCCWPLGTCNRESRGSRDSRRLRVGSRICCFSLVRRPRSIMRSTLSDACAGTVSGRFRTTSDCRRHARAICTRDRSCNIAWRVDFPKASIECCSPIRSWWRALRNCSSRVTSPNHSTTTFVPRLDSGSIGWCWMPLSRVIRTFAPPSCAPMSVDAPCATTTSGSAIQLSS